MHKRQFWLAVIALMLCGNFAKAQFKTGEILGSAGLGIGAQFTGSSLIPPVSLMGEYAITENILGGLYAGYASSRVEDQAWGLIWNNNQIILGVRGSYNLELTENLDVYGGAFVGYSFASARIIEGTMPLFGNLTAFGVSETRLAGFVGGRYLFDNKFGVFGEIGYGISFVNVGLTLNLGRHELPFM
ncbi:hypothetical protein [Croceimicrobium sp.]|uniref:hypothetical protein n=1 Tax=Croceimicrobium sp. TaxID=2828340 RepID=UPI003BAC52EB